MIAMRVSGWTMRMSAAAMIWLPAPNATPCTAAITGTGISRQPHAAYCALFAIPRVRSDKVPPALLAPGSRSLLRLERSSPAQKARLTRQHDDVQASRRLQLIDRLGQCFPHCGVERVHLVGADQADVGDPAFEHGDRNTVFHGRILFSV